MSAPQAASDRVLARLMHLHPKKIDLSLGRTLRLLAALGSVGEAYVAEVERIVRLYLAEKDSLEPVPAGELLDRARKGLVTVLDVRPREEFAAGHLPGAVNIPIGQLRTRVDELPRDREILVICRSGQRAYYATRTLLQKGFNARTLAGGMLSRTHASTFWES